MSGIRLRLNGAELSQKYKGADPFPHVVLDRLFEDQDLKRILQEFPDIDSHEWNRFKSGTETKLAANLVETMPPFIREFLQFMNSPVMLQFVEDLTGIESLIPDPYYWGGGMHQIVAGGFLKVHADFNWHSRLKLHRRVNLLVYLNEDWREEFGGHLELWDREMKRCAVKVLPVFNRTVVFNTTSDSYHGHPVPLSCPEGRTRKSLALYYYSAARPQHELKGAHTTLFRQTPGEKWALTFRDRLESWMVHWTPPIIYDWLKNRRIRNRP